MQRRLIAAIAAVLLAGIGAILLFNYVASADQRAMEGLAKTNVLVVTQRIPAGTPVSKIGSSVQLKEVPAMAVVTGALNSLDGVANLSTNTALEVGEQLIPARFAEAGTAADGTITVPDDMQVVTIQLDAQRAAGNTLQMGNRVSVYVVANNKAAQMFGNVLVVSPATQNASGLITMALPPSEALRLILATESAKVWLVKEAKNPVAVAPVSMGK